MNGQIQSTDALSEHNLSNHIVSEDEGISFDALEQDITQQIGHNDVNHHDGLSLDQMLEYERKYHDKIGDLFKDNHPQVKSPPIVKDQIYHILFSDTIPSKITNSPEINKLPEVDKSPGNNIQPPVHPQFARIPPGGHSSMGDILSGKQSSISSVGNMIISYRTNKNRSNNNKIHPFIKRDAYGSPLIDNYHTGNTLIGRPNIRTQLKTSQPPGGYDSFSFSEMNSLAQQNNLNQNNEGITNDDLQKDEKESITFNQDVNCDDIANNIMPINNISNDSTIITDNLMYNNDKLLNNKLRYKYHPFNNEINLAGDNKPKHIITYHRPPIGGVDHIQLG